MSIVKKIQNLDLVTKGGIIIILMIVAYIIFLLLLKPVFISKETIKSHTVIMNDHIMSFVNPEERNLNTISIFLSFVCGFVLWLFMKGKQEQKENLAIIKKVLSEDEKRIISEIEKTGEITQDSLRFRLNWSKAKVSALLLQLDRMNLIQRERQGKTYKVILAKQK